MKNPLNTQNILLLSLSIVTGASLVSTGYFFLHPQHIQSPIQIQTHDKYQYILQIESINIDTNSVSAKIINNSSEPPYPTVIFYISPNTIIEKQVPFKKKRSLVYNFISYERLSLSDIKSGTTVFAQLILNDNSLLEAKSIVVDFPSIGDKN